MDNKMRRLIIVAVILFVGMWAFSGYAAQTSKNFKESVNAANSQESEQTGQPEKQTAPAVPPNSSSDTHLDTTEKEIIVIHDGKQWKCSGTIYSINEEEIPDKCSKV